MMNHRFRSSILKRSVRSFQNRGVCGSRPHTSLTMLRTKKMIRSMATPSANTNTARAGSVAALHAPERAIQAPVADSFCQVTGADVLRAGEVCNRPGDAQNTIVGARG